MSYKFQELISDLKIENRSIRNEPLFKFKGASISLADAIHNTLIMGGTGEGKTNLIRNGLETLVAKECPGLILDVKGDYKRYLMDIAPDRTVLIGATPECDPVNLIGQMSCEKFISFIAAEIANQTSEKYWGTGGIRDIEFLFRCFQSSSVPTLSKLYDALLSPENHLPELIKQLESCESVDEALLRSYESARLTPFGMVQRIKYNYANNQKIFEQYEWHTAGILSRLKDFSHNPLIREKLSSGDAFDIASLIYDQNKIVVLDMPITKFGDVAYRVARLLRQQLVDAIFSRSEFKLTQTGFGLSKFSFLLIDEYQQYINVVNRSNESGLYDDNLILDKTRQYGHINILATQGLSSLYAQSNENGVNSLTQNCRNQIVFGSNDLATVKHVAEISNDEEVAEKIMKPERKGRAYVYAAHANCKDGSALSGYFRCPENKWLPVAVEETDIVSRETIKNPFYKKPSRRNNTKVKDLRVLNHSGRIVLIAEHQRLVSMFEAQLKSKAGSGNYTVENYILGPNITEEELDSYLEGLCLEKGDALCFLNQSHMGYRESLKKLRVAQKLRAAHKRMPRYIESGVVAYVSHAGKGYHPIKHFAHYFTSDVLELAALFVENNNKARFVYGPEHQNRNGSVLLISTGLKAESEFFSVYNNEAFGEIKSHQIFRLTPKTDPSDIANWLSLFDVQYQDKVCFIREHSSAVEAKSFESKELVKVIQTLEDQVDFLVGVNDESTLNELVSVECVTPQEVAYMLNTWWDILSGKVEVTLKRKARKVRKIRSSDGE